MKILQPDNDDIPGAPASYRVDNVIQPAMRCKTYESPRYKEIQTPAMQIDRRRHASGSLLLLAFATDFPRVGSISQYWPDAFFARNEIFMFAFHVLDIEQARA